MAHLPRIISRNRTGPQRGKGPGDENAAVKQHFRQSSISNGVSLAGGAVRVPLATTVAHKIAPTRTALGELTITAVNRKNSISVAPKDKDSTDVNLKKNVSSSFTTIPGPRRVPLGPAKSQLPAPVASRVAVNTRVQRVTVIPQPARPPLQPLVEEARPIEVHDEDAEGDDDVELQDNEDLMSVEDDAEAVVNDDEVEAMVGVESDEEDYGEAPSKVHATRGTEMAPSQFEWPAFSTEQEIKYRREIDAIRETYDDPIDTMDPAMVSEYADEIFAYMEALESEMMPSDDYMSKQNEITWPMRQTLVDWLLQVHMRYHMLGETLWIAVNIVDRFLTKRTVSVAKLQLVGVTAMFIASKYEEILAPSVDEFVKMTENGYTREEILKGERIVLQTIDFKVSNYCSPYSWMRKISKADDYDIQTRTLSKFLTEVTLLDHRFLQVKPSLIAAVGMYTSRRMLGGVWNEAFVFYSDYTEEQILPGHRFLLARLASQDFEKQNVSKKYGTKKFLKASIYAIEWARTNLHAEGGEGMMLEE